MSRHEQKVARHVRQGLASAGVKFTTFDESRPIPKLTMEKLIAMKRKLSSSLKVVGDIALGSQPKPRRRRFKAIDVACPKCGAEPGQTCTSHGTVAHNERWLDVDAVQKAYDTLLEIDR